MALFKPGIYENLVFTNDSKINEHGTLEIAMKIASGKDDMMSALMGNSTLETMEQSFRFYPPSVTVYNEPNTKKSSDDVAKELLRIRRQLLEYGELVGTKEEAIAAFGGIVMFTRLGVAQSEIENILGRLNDETVLKSVLTSLVTAFLTYMKSKPNFTTVKFRHKFHRQSSTKAYAAIPNNNDPFVESMDVPKEASKLGWSAYEIANHKNTDAEITADAKTADAVTAKSLFNVGTPNPEANNSPGPAGGSLFNPTQGTPI
jgi:hypothetical protein